MKTRASTRAATRARKRQKESPRGGGERTPTTSNDLKDACFRGDYARVVELLGRSEWTRRVNDVGPDYASFVVRHPSLVHAVGGGDDRIVRALLDAGADPTFIGARGRSVLHFAVWGGNIGALAMLLACEDVDPNVQDDDGDTPLLRCCHHSPGFTRALLGARADPNICNDLGLSPLSWAIVCNLEEHVRLLLEAGADPDLADPTSGKTPLTHAIQSDLTPIVARLLRAGADPNLPTGYDDAGPLTTAVAAGQRENSDLLLKAGADPDGTVFGHPAPLLLASQKGDEFLVRLLLEAKANPNPSSESDRPTPLLGAVQGGRVTIVQILLDSGADPNWAGSATTAKDVAALPTPLDLAVERGEEAMVRILLAGKADPNIASNGQLPLHKAAKSGNASVVKLLLDFGADPSLSTNGPDLLPLYVAAKEGRHDVTLLLLRYQLFSSHTSKPL